MVSKMRSLLLKNLNPVSLLFSPNISGFIFVLLVRMPCTRKGLIHSQDLPLALLTLNALHLLPSHWVPMFSLKSPIQVPPLHKAPLISPLPLLSLPTPHPHDLYRIMFSQETGSLMTPLYVALQCFSRLVLFPGENALTVDLFPYFFTSRGAHLVLST